MFALLPAAVPLSLVDVVDLVDMVDLVDLVDMVDQVDFALRRNLRLRGVLTAI